MLFSQSGGLKITFHSDAYNLRTTNETLFASILRRIKISTSFQIQTTNARNEKELIDFEKKVRTYLQHHKNQSLPVRNFIRHSFFVPRFSQKKLGNRVSWNAQKDPSGPYSA